MIALAIAAAAATFDARAAKVVIHDTRCVTAPSQRVHDMMTDYEGYVKLPGAKYEMKIAHVGKLPLLTMVKSQSRYTARDARETDAKVWVVLQPTNLTDAAYYPRFLLHCVSHHEGERNFTHTCALEAEKPHYGLDGFNSTLEATADAPSCEKGQLRLEYTLTLTSNDSHVEEIKKKVVEPAGLLGPILAKLFNEETFFRGYYLNFYESAVQAL